MTGLSLALSEITLVVFTTLAPSGAVALALLCAPIVFGKGPASTNDGKAGLIKSLWIPILVTMVGLVASATHLGNPSNALYVLTGIGRSPLSTEVGAAVAFLAASGLFWLYGFSERPRTGLQRTWAGILVALAVAFVTAVAFAYCARTIPSWDTPLVPAALWCGALTGGPVLALAVLRGAVSPAASRIATVLLAVAGIAALAGMGVGIAQGLALPGLHSSLTSADALVPHYWWMLAGATILQLGGLALAWYAACHRETNANGKHPTSAHPADRKRFAPTSPLAPQRPTLALAGVSVLVFAGLFITRFAFYMMHLTSGL